MEWRLAARCGTMQLARPHPPQTSLDTYILSHTIYLFSLPLFSSLPYPCSIAPHHAKHPTNALHCTEQLWYTFPPALTMQGPFSLPPAFTLPIVSPLHRSSLLFFPAHSPCLQSWRTLSRGLCRTSCCGNKTVNPQKQKASEAGSWRFGRPKPAGASG